jgi:TorA maturation chaperone TorD
MELFRALGALVEAPGRETERLAALLDIPAPTSTEHTELFLLNLHPYASIYLGPEGMLGGEGRDRIAGFWRALGQTPPAEPDHLALMLAQYAGLAELAAGEPDDARRAALSRARDVYLHEHLVSWLPVYLDKLVELAPPSYAGWGRLLEQALEGEARRLDGSTRHELPLGLRHYEPPALGSEDGLDRILDIVLSPARSGMILAHADVARAGRSLGLGVRMADRRFALRTLFSQAPAEVMLWLRAEAEAWIARHAARREKLGAIASAWEQRARAFVSLADTILESLAQASSPSPA